MRKKSGRPSIEEDQPKLLKAIVNIAMHGCAADDRRKSETVRSVKSLYKSTEELGRMGFIVSRSGVYVHLLPKRSSSLEGKRHLKTMPVKLVRAQNDAHKDHVDAKFAANTIHNLEDIASLLGLKAMCLISQDDKARIPLGITAANKQAPLKIHVEYKVTLPDHDWVVAGGHKLIPSVYAGIEIKDRIGRNAVTYSGPTYIAIRSGKHASSTAYSHALDVDRSTEKTSRI